jgi:hypothetical protein
MMIGPEGGNLGTKFPLGEPTEEQLKDVNK